MGKIAKPPAKGPKTSISLDSQDVFHPKKAFHACSGRPRCVGAIAIPASPAMLASQMVFAFLPLCILDMPSLALSRVRKEPKISIDVKIHGVAQVSFDA